MPISIVAGSVSGIPCGVCGKVSEYDCGCKSLSDQMIEQADAIMQTLFNPRDRRNDAARRTMVAADLQYEQRITEDRRIHRPECVAGMCTCSQEE